MLKKITDDNSLVSEFPALRLVKTSRQVRFAGKLTFTLLMLSLASAFWVPWRQTARGTGSVLALDPQLRPQMVRSQTKGIVDWVKPDLREGSYVEQGEQLLRLSPFAADAIFQWDMAITATKDKLEFAKSALDVAERQLTAQVASGESLQLSLEQDLEATQQKLFQAQSKVEELRAELQDKENLLQNAQVVAAPGVGLQSVESLFSKQRLVDSMKQKVRGAEQYAEEQQKTLDAKASKLKAETEKIAIDNDKARGTVFDYQQKINTIQKELADLSNKRDELNRLDVTAPRSGYIQQWNGLQGSDVVKEGEQLFVLVPKVDELAVEMQVRGNDMPLVREGFPVRIQFEGYPAIQTVGWPSTAVGTFGGKVNRISPTDNGMGSFTVVIVPDKHFDRDKDWPDGRYLRQGVRANGWVLLNQVPLGFEIWRQLNGFPPVITDKKPDGEKEKESKIKLPKA